MDEALSLAELNDIVLPAAPPLWPPAPGIWVLLVLFAVTAVSVWRWRRQAMRRNAYRRAGLALLGQARSVHEVSVLLKRVALAAWPRERVASLHGREWARFLNDHCRGCRFDEDAWQHPEAAADPGVLDNAARWVRGHRHPGPEDAGR